MGITDILNGTAGGVVVGKIWINHYGFRDVELKTDEWQSALSGFMDGESVKIIIIPNITDETTKEIKKVPSDQNS